MATSGSDAGSGGPEHSRWEPDDALDLVLFRNLLRAPDILYFKDRQSRYLRLSRGAQEALVGDAPGGQVGASDFDHYEHGHAMLAFEQEQSIISSGEPLLDVVEQQKWPDRDDTWVSTTKMPLFDPSGDIIGTFGISRDVSPRILAEREAQRASDELKRILETSPDAIARFDAGLRFTYLNPAAARLLPAGSDTVIGTRIADLIQAAPSAKPWEAALARVVRTGEPDEAEFSLYADGQTRWFNARVVPALDAAGEIVGALSSSRDVTNLKLAEEALEHEATHDNLTGLANRALLRDRLSQALLRLPRSGGLLAVLFVDLDGFKGVNDRCGHAVGDLVLIETGRRLVATARSLDTAARFGGDEFVLVCENLPNTESVGRLAGRVEVALAKPYEAAPGEGISASVGFAITDDFTCGADTLLRQADEAMYRQKHSSRRHPSQG